MILLSCHNFPPLSGFSFPLTPTSGYDWNLSAFTEGLISLTMSDSEESVNVRVKLVNKWSKFLPHHCASLLAHAPKSRVVSLSCLCALHTVFHPLRFLLVWIPYLADTLLILTYSLLKNFVTEVTFVRVSGDSPTILRKSWLLSEPVL